MVRDEIQFWDVPEIWPGEAVVIVGGGPSLKGYDWENFKRLKFDKGFRAIGINDAFRLGSIVDICFFGDDKWWLERGRLLAEFKGLCVSLAPCNKDAKPRPNWVKMLRRDAERPFGITNEKRQGRDTIAFNTNSGTAAVGLAALLGCKKIILLGFDMDIQREGSEEIHNWHNYHSRKSSPTVYDAWRGYWSKYMIPDLRKRKIECMAVAPSKLIDLGLSGIERVKDGL
jgi:hypothetical protein